MGQMELLDCPRGPSAGRVRKALVLSWSATQRDVSHVGWLNTGTKERWYQGNHSRALASALGFLATGKNGDHEEKVQVFLRARPPPVWT